MHSAHTTLPKISRQQQPANLAFISDSIFKFLVEDKVSLQFLIQHDCERNIRLFRGYSAQKIAQTVTQQHFEELRQHNVDKLAVSLGTVDLCSMHFTREPPETVAERVAGALTQLATAANDCNIQFLYVIPGYTHNITSKEHTQFVNALHTHLTDANISSISIAAVMAELARKMNISDHEMTLENFTSDGGHITSTICTSDITQM